MSLPAVGDRCFYDLRLGKFGMYFKNPGVIAVFYGQFLRFFKTYRLFYFHDFLNRIGYFDVIVQSSELSGLAADGVEWNESTRV